MCLIETFRGPKDGPGDEASTFSSYVLQRSMGPNVFLDSHSDTKEGEYSLIELYRCKDESRSHAPADGRLSRTILGQRLPS
jgi:hypothetical protein